MFYSSMVAIKDDDNLRYIEYTDKSMVRWMCIATMKNGSENEELRCKLGKKSINEVMRTEEIAMLWPCG